MAGRGARPGTERGGHWHLGAWAEGDRVGISDLTHICKRALWRICSPQGSSAGAGLAAPQAAALHAAHTRTWARAPLALRAWGGASVCGPVMLCPLLGSGALVR